MKPKTIDKGSIKPKASIKKETRMKPKVGDNDKHQKDNIPKKIKKRK
jgi:hypothetical protein